MDRPGSAVYTVVTIGIGEGVQVHETAAAGHEVAEAHPLSPYRSDDSARRETILVCDDHADIVELLSAILELEGFTAVPAYCGADALREVRSRPIDLVLLDKAMPDIDGFEVCQQIKTMFHARFLPVILVTANTHKDDRLAGLNMGADDYITKPFDLDEVLAKVRVMLRIKRIEDQLVQRNAALASFNAVASAIGESLILEEMLHIALGEIMRLMDIPCGWIFLRNMGPADEKIDHDDPGTATATEMDASLVAHLGIDHDPAAKITIEGSLLAHLSQSPESDYSCPWIDGEFRARNNIQSCVGVPLTSKGRLRGIMTLASHTVETFERGAQAMQVLQSLGAELGIAIEHALLYRDTQQTVERLREIDAIKSQFISTASHEFRTPLSIIKGFANLLTRKEDFGFDRETENDYLHLIDGQIDALTVLVEDMLSASRIESGHVQVHPQTLDAGALIARTATPIALQARDRAIHVSVDVPTLEVVVDQSHLEQIVSNLLSNAVKYSEDGREVLVRLYKEGEDARIDVIDHGVGIQPEQIGALFQRFSRIDNVRAIEAGGTGLGLYIAKNWVEINGGRIWVDSRLGDGCTFSFTVPLATSA